MTTSNIYRDVRGFTLIEILVALFILSVGILGVTGMFITAIKANQLARTTTAGTRLAQNLQEQAKTAAGTNTVFSNMGAAGITSLSPAGGPAVSQTIVAGDTFTRGGIFREMSGINRMVNYSAILQMKNNIAGSVASQGLDTWTARVKWKDSFGRHEIELNTYIENGN